MTLPPSKGVQASETAVAVAGVLAVGGLAWHHMAILGDGFWGAASGIWMIAHRAMPEQDPFSFASVSDRWIVVSPGTCLLLGAVASAFGLQATMILGTAVEAFAVGLLWLRSSRRAFTRLALLPLALFFIQCDSQDLSVRGQLFGDVGFVLLLGLVSRLRDGKRVHPAWIILGSALWTNLHPSFLLIVILPLACGTLLLLDPPGSRPRLRPFAVTSGLALLGTVLNPYGPTYLRHAAMTAFAGSTQSYDLFRSPDFHDFGWLAAPAIGLALTIARGRFGPNHARRGEQAFLLAWVCAACVSRRNAPQLVGVELSLLAPMLDAAILRRWESEREFGARWAAALQRLRTKLPAASLTASAFLLLLAWGWLREPKDALRDVPALAADAARTATSEQASAGSWPNRIVNPLHWGGYLAYAWMGGPRYFIDGRDNVVLFGNGANEDAAALWTAAPGCEQLLDTYEAGTVLWERGAPLDRLLRSRANWRLLYEDRIAVVYVRRFRAQP